jgi:hypothetical protein
MSANVTLSGFYLVFNIMIFYSNVIPSGFLPRRRWSPQLTDAPVWSPDQREKESLHLIKEGGYNAVGRRPHGGVPQMQEFYAAGQTPHSGIHKSFAIGGLLRPPIKSAGKFQLYPLSNQRCLSQA